jgi:hypothetical protein
MKRFLSLALAFSILGYFASQEPISVADAYPGDGGNGGATSQATKNQRLAGGVLLAYGAYQAAGHGIGSIGLGKMGGLGGSSPIYDITSGHSSEFELLTKILENAGDVERYRKDGPYTVFWPNDQALIKALGGERVAQLQSPTGKGDARAFLESLTVVGSYNLSRLSDVATQGKTLTTLSGKSVVLKNDAGKLSANGIELVQVEYPASNGFVLIANGLITHNDE